MTVEVAGEKAPSRARRVGKAVLRGVGGLAFALLLGLIAILAWLESGPRWTPDRRC